MFIGHALLAFALVAAGTAAYGTSRERALALGVVAGLFAAIPDVDISYALVGVVTAQANSALALANSFWSTGNVVHRAVTHSLLVAPVVALAAALVADGLQRASRWRSRLALAASVAVVTGLVVVAGFESGVVGAVVMALFGLAALAVAAASVRWKGFDGRTTFALALFGVASHPFGDLFTGEPPAMLYPLDVTLFPHRVTLNPDATLNLLGAFGIELLTIWLAIVVCLRLTGREVRTAVDPRAMVGLAFAGSVFLIPAPTLNLSYPFVFSVLALGTVGLAPRIGHPRRSPMVRLPDAASALVTALATITVAWAAYVVAYLAL